MLLPGEQKMCDGVINCQDDWSCLNLKAKAMDAILPAVYRRDLPTPHPPAPPYHLYQTVLYKMPVEKITRRIKPMRSFGWQILDSGKESTQGRDSLDPGLCAWAQILFCHSATGIEN